MELIVDADCATGEGAGDDRAAALGGEDPVDPQSRPAAIGGGGGGPDQLVERDLQLGETGAGGGADTDDRGRGQEGACEVVADVELLQFAPLLVDEVDLGESDDAVPQADELEDPQVFLALGRDDRVRARCGRAGA